LMGGEAGAQSVLGKGSTFWFTARLGKSALSADELAEVPAIAELNLQGMPAGRRVLLAEDNLINQEVVVELLTNIGLKVEIANNGHEALEKARDEAYDLILMDMQMPGMDGLEATRAIRLLPHQSATPILAMTANAFDEDRRACKEAGMNDFVAKPLNPDVLYTVLLRWLPAETAGPVVSGETEAAPLIVPNATEWMGRAARVPGLDVKLGLGMMRGNVHKYGRLLAMFSDAHAQDATRLSDALASNDLMSLNRLAHALKGSAGNVGAVQVSESAGALLSNIRQAPGSEEVNGCCNALIGYLKSLINGIHSAMRDR